AAEAPGHHHRRAEPIQHPDGPAERRRRCGRQAMADVATIGLLHQRSLHEQTVLSEQLQSALESRVLIEQAKGVPAARAALSVAEAFTRMRAHARRTSTRLTSIARAMIEGTIDVDILTQPELPGGHHA